MEIEQKGSTLPKVWGACCLGTALAITSTFAALYGDLLQRSQAYDDLHASDDPALIYNQCGGLTSDVEGAEFTTNWTLVYKFNTILYILMTSMLAMGCLGMVFPPLIACISCSMCGLCAQTAAIITGGIYRFRSEGAECALVGTAYEGENSWETDGATLKALFIAQCCLAVPMGCFLGCAMAGVTVGTTLKYEEDMYKRQR